MASIGQLVRAVSQVSGLDEASVKLIARYVREAGYIGQQSTGAGAAQMSYSDAASLLIAVNAASLAKDAPEAVREFGGLHLVSIMAFDDSNVESTRSVLTEAGSFGAALAELIRLHLDKQDFSVSVEFMKPKPSVIVTLFDDSSGSEGSRPMLISFKYCADEEARNPECDRSVRVSVTQRTLSRVAEALSN